jgi:hypothetical protein
LLCFDKKCIIMYYYNVVCVKTNFTEMVHKGTHCIMYMYNAGLPLSREIVLKFVYIHVTLTSVIVYDRKHHYFV